ncbi:MAG: SusC/RagA family TonB-linked outer membrane protein [Prolixibacteraceae bacterium]
MTHRYIRNFTITLSLFLMAMSGVSGQEMRADLSNEVQQNLTVFDNKTQINSGAISTITGDELMRQYFGSISNALNGKLLGLQVTEDSGEPGSASASLSIRGYGSYNTREIKIFVDGFETELSFLESISPSEIETITILKDAAALASYGMNGANGVLLVETKRGELGKTKVGINLKSGIQQPTTIYKPLRSYDYASMYNEAVSNDNGMVWSPVYSQPQLDAYQSGQGTDVDWYDEALKDFGSITNGNLSLSGGDINARYFVNFGFLNHQGIYDVPTNDETANALQNKYNVRINLDFKMFSIVEGKVDVSGIVDDRKSPNGEEYSLWNSMANYPSNIYPVQNAVDSWTGTTTYPNNPVATIKAQGYNSTHDRTLQGRMSLKENLDDLVEGLFAEQAVYFNAWTRGTYSRTRSYERIIDGIVQTADVNSNYSIYDDSGTNQWNTKQFTARLGYSKKIGDQALDAGLTYLLQNVNVDANQNGSAGVQTTYNYENLGGYLSYKLKDKYLAELAFAYSGSDNFAKGNRWGFFPTISCAWDLSKEDFLQNSSALNSLKLNASAGQTATDDTFYPRYLYMKYYGGSGNYKTGNTSINDIYGLRELYTPNENIFAEKSMKYNIGSTALLFNNLDVVINAFMDKRSGIVTPLNTISAVFGAIPPYMNAGKVTTKGFETMLRYSKQHGDFSYSVGAMLLLTHNTIDYSGEIEAYENARLTGNPIGSRFGFEADGFYNIDDFNETGSLNESIPVPTFGSVQAGDIRYKDISGDGLIDNEDRVKIGKPYFPSSTYSFNVQLQYKGFYFDALMQGLGGREINLLDISSQSVPFANNNNAYPLIKERWAYYPEQGIDTRASANYPRLSAVNNVNNYQSSSFWQKNASYIKLRNVELGYSFSASMCEKISLSNLRVFLTGHNLFSTSWLEKNYGIDPEFLTGYPSMRSFTLGISIHL